MGDTRLTLRVDFGASRSIGPGKIKLLEAVGTTGSISQAGRALGMSYRRAWLLIDDMNLKLSPSRGQCQARWAAQVQYAGRLSTGYLVDHPEVTMAQGPAGAELDAHLIAIALHDEYRNRAADPVTGFAPSGWRNLRTRDQRRTYVRADEEYRIEYRVAPDVVRVRLGPWPEPGPDGALPHDDRPASDVRPVRVQPTGAGSAIAVVFEAFGRRWSVEVADDGAVVRARSRAGTTELVRPPRFADHDATDGGSGPVSPLPGTVLAVHVAAGDLVVDGTAAGRRGGDEDGAQDRRERAGRGGGGARGGRPTRRRRRSARGDRRNEPIVRVTSARHHVSRHPPTVVDTTQ